ncbi:MAG: hypothetical protein KC505_05560 [Myxococcales bacterium]|nr:hypothetical protein [Myxococcales bacterium]USN51438.1 MAG: hypothetical protein H6731_03250 [Myxococcales bacterium]
MLRKIIFCLFFTASICATNLSQRLDQVSVNPLMSPIFRAILSDIDKKLEQECELKDTAKALLAKKNCNAEDLNSLKQVFVGYLKNLAVRDAELEEFFDELSLINW